MICEQNEMLLDILLEIFNKKLGLLEEGFEHEITFELVFFFSTVTRYPLSYGTFR